MSLWIDKYRPKTIDKLDCHVSITNLLKRLSASQDFPHLLFCGPSGSGKKTRVTALIREIFGPGIDKMRIVEKSVNLPSGRSLDISFLSSNYHMEISPSEMGVHDKTVIQELIKDIAQTRQIDMTARRGFKVIVIDEADLITHDAQAALRRTMEKYASNIKLILCSTSTSRLIGPIRSRCFCIRVPAYSTEHASISKLIGEIAQKEGANVDECLINTIAIESCGNLRKAILMLESSVSQRCRTSEELTKISPDWELVVKQLAEAALAVQSPEQLLKCREYFYRLLSHCIPPETILQNLLLALMQETKKSTWKDVIRDAAICDHRFRLGSKHIFHLEAFIAKFMSKYEE